MITLLFFFFFAVCTEAFLFPKIPNSYSLRTDLGVSAKMPFPFPPIFFLERRGMISQQNLGLALLELNKELSSFREEGSEVAQHTWMLK